MNALLYALANLARLRWLGAAFCALAIVCTTAKANAIAPGTEHEQTKTRVGGFEQNSSLNVCANTLASAETHRGISSAQCETASAFSHAAEGVTTLDASAIQFSQSSVSGLQPIVDSMSANGWVGAPVDVVSIGDQLITVDNTRVLAASLTNTPVQAMMHSIGEALPESMAGRFGNAMTWGDAVTSRIGGQNAAYQSLYPLGSWYIGVSP